jgi:hypothetical protein
MGLRAAHQSRVSEPQFTEFAEHDGEDLERYKKRFEYLISLT